MSGIVLTRRLSEEAKGIKILIAHPARGQSLSEAGSRCRRTRLRRQAIRGCESGLCHSIGNRRGNLHRSRHCKSGPQPLLGHNHVSVPEIRDLTDRETEVLKLSSLGLTNKEISHRIGVGVKSVETFKSRGLAKLEIQSSRRPAALCFTSWMARGHLMSLPHPRSQPQREL